MAKDLTPVQIADATASAASDARTEAGPEVNYTRIDDALATHRATLSRVEQLAAMQALAATGAKAYLSIDGDKGMPLEIGQDAAAELIGAALVDATTTASTLGTVLNALSKGLPS